MDDVIKLTPEQKKAVRHRKGPLLLVAGPGTGKTVVVTFLSLSPFVALFGGFALFLVYRFLILVRVLKFEEVERKVKRLTLA